MSWQVMMTKDDERTPIYWRFNPSTVKSVGCLGSALCIGICTVLIYLGTTLYRQSEVLVRVQAQLDATTVAYDTLQTDFEMQLKQLEEAIRLPRGGPSVATVQYTMDEVTQREADDVPDNEPDNEPTYRPCEGPITSYFGARENPFVEGAEDYHKGIDIGAPTGTPIYAAGAGEVIQAGYMSGYGYVVFIDHGNGKETRYAHASTLDVQKGQEVTKGEQIAAVGSTGNSTGPHLHFELLEGGVQKNPEKLFLGE